MYINVHETAVYYYYLCNMYMYVHIASVHAILTVCSCMHISSIVCIVRGHLGSHSQVYVITESGVKKQTMNTNILYITVFYC